MANYAEKPQMGFIEACSTACKKIVTFKGRARRSEFWWAVLGIIIFNLIMTPVNYMGKTGVIISNLLSLVITILSLSLTFRRLHDTGRSGRTLHHQHDWFCSHFLQHPQHGYQFHGTDRNPRHAEQRNH